MNKFQKKLLLVGVISFSILCFLFLSLYWFQKFIPEVSQEKGEQFPCRAEDLTSEDINRIARYINASEIAEVSLSQGEINLLVEQKIVNEKEAEELLAIEHLLNKGNVD